MTLADHYDFDELGFIVLAAEMPKLPFDANDYHTLELNEDFIVPSASFVNNYASSPGSVSGTSAIDDIEQLSQNSLDGRYLPEFDDDDIIACIDQTIEKYANGLLNDADVCTGVLSPLIFDENIATMLHSNIDTTNIYTNTCYNNYAYFPTSTSIQNIPTGSFHGNIFTPTLTSGKIHTFNSFDIEAPS